MIKPPVSHYGGLDLSERLQMDLANAVSTLWPSNSLAIVPEHQPVRQLVTWTEQTQLFRTTESTVSVCPAAQETKQWLYLEFPPPANSTAASLVLINDDGQ